jgi:hypothetical protein
LGGSERPFWRSCGRMLGWRGDDLKDGYGTVAGRQTQRGPNREPTVPPRSRAVPLVCATSRRVFRVCSRISPVKTRCYAEKSHFRRVANRISRPLPSTARPPIPRAGKLRRPTPGAKHRRASSGCDTAPGTPCPDSVLPNKVRGIASLNQRLAPGID